MGRASISGLSAGQLALFAAISSLVLLSPTLSASSNETNTNTAPTTLNTSTTTTTTTTPSNTQAINKTVAQTSSPAALPTDSTITACAPDSNQLQCNKLTINNNYKEEVKKIIRQHIDQNHMDNRLSFNKPTSAPQMQDFAPDSIEARVSDATSAFGLAFLNNLAGVDEKENVVFSPLSLQNLLNMILLGTQDNSETQQELARVLNYDSNNLLTPNAGNNTTGQDNNRLLPHQAMRNVFQSILTATHLSLSQSADPDLLNTNSGSLTGVPAGPEPPKPAATVTAHLQTSNKEGEQVLSGQLNFTLANLVLTNKDLVSLKQEYENDLKSYYDVNVEQFSRSKPASNATGTASSADLPLYERVNSWVKRMTQNQIEKLANKDDLNEQDLIMVLLNAAHFKGRWLHTFNARATYEGSFYNNGNRLEAAQVMFMRQKGMFGYADFGSASLQGEMQASDSRVKSSDDAETLLTEDGVSSNKGPGGQNSAAQAPTIVLSKEDIRRVELTSKLNCTVLMLPFSLNEGQELSMVILLPTSIDGLAQLQANLNAQTLNEIYRWISEQQVQVEIPKFSFESSHDAKATLMNMGLKSIFRDSSHLTRMLDERSGARQAKVDKVVHKAKINVDESGAEAAAASMASVVLRNFIRPPTPIFMADHPFLFIIRHNRSNMPLFMGRVTTFN